MVIREGIEPSLMGSKPSVLLTNLRGHKYFIDKITSILTIIVIVALSILEKLILLNQSICSLVNIFYILMAESTVPDTEAVLTTLIV